MPAEKREAREWSRAMNMKGLNLNTHDTAPLCTKIAARVIGVDPRTMEQWRYQGKGPAYLKIQRQVRYLRDDLDAWLSGRRIEPEAHGLR